MEWKPSEEVDPSLFAKSNWSDSLHCLMSTEIDFSIPPSRLFLFYFWPVFGILRLFTLFLSLFLWPENASQIPEQSQNKAIMQSRLRSNQMPLYCGYKLSSMAQFTGLKSNMQCDMMPSSWVARLTCLCSDVPELQRPYSYQVVERYAAPTLKSQRPLLVDYRSHMFYKWPRIT